MGTVDEIRGRVQVSGDIGERLDKSKEAAANKAQQIEGAIVAFKTSAKAVALLHKHVDKDLEQVGQEDCLFPSGGTDLQIASYVKRYITRAEEACSNLHEKSKNELFVANGRVAAMTEAVAVVQKYHNAGMARAAQLAQAMQERFVEESFEGPESGEPPETEEQAQERRKARAPGEHPGESPHARRREEALRVKMEVENGRKG